MLRHARWWLGIPVLGALALWIPEAQAMKPLVVGGRAGLSISRMIGDDNDPPRHERYGFGGGVFARFPMSALVSFQPEVLMVSKGLSWGEIPMPDPFDGFLEYLETSLVLNYVEVPLLLRFSPRSGKPLRPVFVLGPYMGFETNEGLKVRGQLLGWYDSSVIHDFDVGGVAGLGVELAGAGMLWSLDARSDLGAITLTDAGRNRNWNVLVTVGLAFDPAR